jgi:predicted ATPase/DNA-binding CsgD family transcriptional regulator
MSTTDERAIKRLPFALGTLIGRETEAAEIVTLLATARLLTLTGPGGSGKSRLAAYVAQASRAIAQDGIRWVELGSLHDPALVPQVVAARCGIADQSRQAVLDSLVAAFSGHVLLVLDGCEHLLSACVDLIGPLLAACPHLHILATSRESLALPGEVIWQVAPLRVPESDISESVENLMSYDAVALFVTRAAETLPTFHLTPENAPSVARICRRLDGLPLALELAAARLRVLSPAELANRLDDPLSLLTRGSRTAPARQQTLRATLDWSYQLLSESEQALFTRLAVFADSFPLEAAEQICAQGNEAENEVLALLARLVEKSLVVVRDAGNETRYRLLEPVRQYAREQLIQAGMTEYAHQRYLDWYLALASSASIGLSGPEQGRWLDHLEDEQENVRAALGWAISRGKPSDAGRLAAGIWNYWLLRGYLQEGRRWLEQILAAMPGPSPLRAHLLWIAGILANPDIAQAKRWFDESLALWQEFGESEGAARTLSSLGFMSQAAGDHRQAIRCLEQSLDLLRSSNDAATQARVLTGLSLSLLESGDLERAMSCCLDGRVFHEQSGDVRGVAATVANLGLIWQARGDTGRAAEYWEESLDLRRQIGDLGGQAHVLYLLGSLAVNRREYTRATSLFSESLALRIRIGDEAGIPQILEGTAGVLAARNEQARAVKVAAAAGSFRIRLGMPPSSWERANLDRTLANLRDRLGAAPFAQAWDAGAALSPGQAIAEARVSASESSVGVSGFTLAEPSSTLTAAPPSRANSLTRRETDVLRLLTFGLTYAQIAENLMISPRTVDAHVRSIFSKLDVHSRSAATRVALQEKLI